MFLSPPSKWTSPKFWILSESLKKAPTTWLSDTLQKSRIRPWQLSAIDTHFQASDDEKWVQWPLQIWYHKNFISKTLYIPPFPCWWSLESSPDCYQPLMHIFRPMMWQKMNFMISKKQKVPKSNFRKRRTITFSLHKDDMQKLRRKCLLRNREGGGPRFRRSLIRDVSAEGKGDAVNVDAIFPATENLTASDGSTRFFHVWRDVSSFSSRSASVPSFFSSFRDSLAILLRNPLVSSFFSSSCVSCSKWAKWG